MAGHNDRPNIYNFGWTFRLYIYMEIDRYQDRALLHTHSKL